VGQGRGARRDTRTAYLLLVPSLFGVGEFLVLPILVVARRIYYEAFEQRAVGQAAVMALVLFVLLVVVTLVQQRWFARRTTCDLST
jgi:ABC-type sugar transport system permease subunit